MGGNNSKEIVPTNKILSRISAKDKQNFKLHFEQHAKTSDLKAGKILKEQFIEEYLKKRFPKLCKDLLARFYSVLANKRKDFIQWEEFLQAEYLFSFTPNEEVIFKAKNADDIKTPEDEILMERTACKL